MRQLIAGCLDDEHTLHYESGVVGPGVRSMLNRLADERGRFAARLYALGEPGARASISWVERLRVFGRATLVLAGGPNNGDSIAACRRSRDRVEDLYTTAMTLPWAQPILPTLLEQKSSIEDAREELLSLQF